MARSAPGKGHPGNAPGGAGPGAGRTGGGTKTGGTGNSGASSFGGDVLDALRDALPDVTGPSRFGTGGDLQSGQGAGGSTGGGLQPVAPQLPQIEDTPPPADPVPQDLTPLIDAPKRKPIRSALGSFAGSAGITGQAGVFIP